MTIPSTGDMPMTLPPENQIKSNPYGCKSLWSVPDYVLVPASGCCTNEKLTFLCLNVCGLRSRLKYDDFVDYISSLMFWFLSNQKLIIKIFPFLMILLLILDI